MMRKFITMAIAALVAVQTAEAQNWQELLRRLTGGPAEKKTEQPAGEQPAGLTAAALCSTWTYSAPAMKYEGDDMLASIALKGIEGYLPSLYAKVGLAKGSGRATFTTTRAVHAEAGTHKASGSYSFDPSTGELTVTVKRGGASVDFHGSATLEEGALVLLFDASEAADIMERMSDKAAQNDNFKMMKSLLDKYPGIKLGCRMTK